MSLGKIILGTLSGLAFGAIAGILLAPEKGSKTRKQIKDKGDGYVNEIKSKVEKYSNSLAKKLESTKNDAEKIVQKGKAKYATTKKEAKNAAS